MQKVSIGNADSYKKEFENFTTSNLFIRLQEKFRIKPYHEENRLLRKVVLFSSYLFNLFSIITSFYFAYSLFSSFLGLVLGIMLSISMLIILEGLKRIIIPSIFKAYFQFKSKSYLKSIVAVVMVALSAFFSYGGADVAINEFSFNTEVLQIDSIRGYYVGEINLRHEQQEQLSNVKYKGTTTRTAQKAITALQSEINDLRKQETALLSLEIEEHEGDLKTDKNKKYFHSLIFSLLALCFDLSLIFCLVYLEYYDYRSISEFAKVDTVNTVAVPTIEHKNDSLGGGAKELIKKEVINDSRTIANDSKKNCLNCQAVFDVSNPKKKFCSTSCRVGHWNMKNKKALTVPTT
jgi:TRAP-type C4-dicarboxylate transport system permease small subunit